jgi:hypothetical protein
MIRSRTAGIDPIAEIRLTVLDGGSWTLRGLVGADGVPLLHFVLHLISDLCVFNRVLLEQAAQGSFNSRTNLVLCARGGLPRQTMKKRIEIVAFCYWHAAYDDEGI